MPAERQQTESAKEVVEANVFRDGCPQWESGTILMRNRDGSLVGYGRLKRTGDSSAEIEIGSPPAGVRLLSSCSDDE